MWAVCIVRKLAGLHPSTLPPPSSARTSIQSGLLPPPGLAHPQATRRHFPNWFPARQGRVGDSSAGLLPLPGRWKSFDGPNICLNPHGDSAEISWCGHSLLLLFCSCQEHQVPCKTNSWDTVAFTHLKKKKALKTTTHPFLRCKGIFLRNREEGNPRASRNKSIIKASCSHERYLRLMQTCEQSCHQACSSSQASSKE